MPFSGDLPDSGKIKTESLHFLHWRVLYCSCHLESSPFHMTAPHIHENMWASWLTLLWISVYSYVKWKSLFHPQGISWGLNIYVFEKSSAYGRYLIRHGVPSPNKCFHRCHAFLVTWLTRLPASAAFLGVCRRGDLVFTELRQPSIAGIMSSRLSLPQPGLLWWL